MSEDGQEVHYMDLNEFQQLGAVAAVNRELLHPVGLALEFAVDPADPTYGQMRVWDDREDSEGTRFEPEGEVLDLLLERLRAFRDLQRSRDADARIAAVGSIVQQFEGIE